MPRVLFLLETRATIRDHCYLVKSLSLILLKEKKKRKMTLRKILKMNVLFVKFYLSFSNYSIFILSMVFSRFNSTLSLDYWYRCIGESFFELSFLPMLPRLLWTTINIRSVNNGRASLVAFRRSCKSISTTVTNSPRWNSFFHFLTTEMSYEFH